MKMFFVFLTTLDLIPYFYCSSGWFLIALMLKQSLELCLLRTDYTEIRNGQCLVRKVGRKCSGLDMLGKEAAEWMHCLQKEGLYYPQELNFCIFCTGYMAMLVQSCDIIIKTISKTKLFDCSLSLCPCFLSCDDNGLPNQTWVWRPS